MARKKLIGIVSGGSEVDVDAKHRVQEREETLMPQTALFPSTVTVKRFVMTFGAASETHYSIRRRSDGLFQVYHDDPYIGINQSYEFHDEQWGGLFGSAEAAEKELLRLRPGLEVMPVPPALE